jgi:predicted nucleic acid-binding protein
LAGEIEAVASEATAREAEAVLGGGWLGRMTSRERVASLLEALRTQTVWVAAPEPITDLQMKDEGDVRLVEAAVTGGASYVVTTDREFLSHRGYGRVEFVTPGEWWKVEEGRRTIGGGGSGG